VADAPALRPATTADAPALAALVRRGVETYRAFMPPGWAPVDGDPMFDPARIREQIATPGAWALVAEDAAEIAAFVLFAPDVDEAAYFASLFVEERWWGRGLGRSLLATAMDEMRRRGYPQARLWVARDYARARRTYEAAGWRPTGAEAVYEVDGTPLVEYRVALAT
jgi:GNAT superfamily N-acetyltransferase